MKYQLQINTRDYAVEIGEIKAGSAEVKVNGRHYDVRIEPSSGVSIPVISSGSISVPPPVATSAGPPTTAAGGDVSAPIPGLILDIRVNRGDSVSAGQIVATMEAMKMENNLTAPISGIVQEVRVQKGAQVSTGDIIMKIR